MRQFVAVVFVFLAVLGTLNAATFEKVTDSDLLDRADLVVAGTVLDVTQRVTEGRVHTDYRLQVEDVLKGNAGSEITISQFGGFANGRGVIIPGTATYEPGSRVLAFLRAADDETYYTAYMGLGQYRFGRDKEGIDILVRDPEGIEFPDGHGAVDVRPANAFIEAIRAGTPDRADRFSGVTSNSRQEFELTPNAVGADYALKCTGGGCTVGRPIRWDGCENCTLTWSNSTRIQSGNSTTDSVVESTIDVWSNEFYSDINLNVAGTNSKTGAQATNSGVGGDDINDIVYDDNFSTGACDGSIGCGLVWFGPTHLYQSITWYSIVSSDIIIRPGPFSQALFEKVLAHEAGHAIGIRHSNQGAPSTTDALMNSTVSSGTPALRPWDREAVASIYGDGLPCEPVEITTTTGAGTIDYGKNVTLKANLIGTAPFAFWWYQGLPGDTSNQVATGNTTSSATSVSFNTPNLTEDTTYWVRVKNCSNTSMEDSSPFNIEVRPCDDVDISTHPLSQRVAPHATVQLTVTATGTASLSYQWYEGTKPDTSKPVGTNSKNFTTPMMMTTKSYWVRITNPCGSVDSNTAVITVGTQCVPATITSQSPSTTGEMGGSKVPLTVSVAGDAPFTYQWYEGNVLDETHPIAGANADTYEAGPFNTHGTYLFWVKVTNACGTAKSSAAIVITVACLDPQIPIIFSPSVVPKTSPYEVSWTGDLSRSPAFDLQEATDAAFTQIQRTFIVDALEQTIDAHSEITVDTRFYYRVRAISICTQQPGEWSKVTSTAVTVPLPSNTTDFSVSVPTGSGIEFVQDVLIEGFGETATSCDTFAVTTDVPWLTPFPSAGALSAGGTTIQLTAATASLPTGTATGSVNIVRTQPPCGASRFQTHGGSSSVSLPFNMSLVTPVTPAPRPADAPPGTLIIPAVAHADGVGARFQSDIRIVNISGDPITYDLSFTGSQTDGTQDGKKTTITINGNDAMSLNDIVKSWYGGGVLGELGLGTLEIRPQGGADPLSTFASSRTYAVTAEGTLGQFIPALGLDKFVGNLGGDPLAKISLQQIANTSAFRTNVGFVEGTGAPVNFLVKLIGADNQVLQQVAKSLPPYGHQQLNMTQIFGNVQVSNARIEVEVPSGTGKVSAYASVLDNATTDPLMIFPEQAGKISSQTYTVPGVAEFDNGVASNFHTDMFIYNSSADPVTLSLDFYPSLGDLQPSPAEQLTLNPYEVKQITNVIPSLWERQGTGGSVKVSAATDASLVVTARTFSRDEEGGTYGQFIPGVTSAQATGMGGRGLQILQLEESPSYRTNFGIVEVTGNNATVEVMAFEPEGKLTAVVHYPVEPNQYYQVNRIFEQMGLGTVYNGRISVKVVGGDGRVAAFGSVIDNRTVDPTYVPAQ